MPAADSYVVDFPTLGDVIDPWISAHCSIPDGFDQGKPYVQVDWQFWCTAKHYEVRPSAKWQPKKPMRNQAFRYRRSQIIGPQKSGKGPQGAVTTCVEAVGPSLFAGWAGEDDGYSCADYGCGCGFEHAYMPGEPMGMPHPSPLIQLTATSEEQVDNVYRPLRTMIKNGPLGDVMLIREGFIRLPGDDNRIDRVTASADSRLGNPVSFVLNDESGLYTKSNKLIKVAETQRRGLAGMQGRGIEYSNMWDPSINSYAQRTYESTSKDVFKFLRKPPAGLSWGNRRERRQILKHVYAGCTWIDLNSIEAEIAELMETDPAQAKRFYGNFEETGQGAWLPDNLWESRYATG